MNFIKKIFVNKIDDSVHKQFTRFGRGSYDKRALLSLWKTNKIKVKSSFEFANDFVLFVANLSPNVAFEGFIWSKEEVEGLNGVKKEGKWIYEVDNLKSDQIKKISDKIYYFLLNGDDKDIKLRIKSKLPKPGKGELKVDDKFCQLELGGQYYNAIKEDFFWDLPECKKAQIEHTFLITDVIIPQGEDKIDYAKIREVAKRKGKIIRIVNVDGKETRKEVNFEV